MGLVFLTKTLPKNRAPATKYFPMNTSLPVHSGANSRRILVLLDDRERVLFAVDEALKNIQADVRFSVPRNSSALAALLQEIQPEVIVPAWSTPALPSGYLEAEDCPVRLVCFVTGSVRRLVPRAYIERGGLVTNWGDVAAPMVAEHALLLLLASLRRLPEWGRTLDQTSAAGDTNPIPITTCTLFGATVSVHGFGHVARALVKLLAPFAVKVRAYSKGVPADYMRSFGVEPVSTLEELVVGGDIFIEVEALNPETKGSVDARMVDLLPPGAIFVNVGRGAVVDETALAARAATGTLRLALDVFVQEPLPADSPLRSIPDLILSPHIGGPTINGLPLAARRAAENIQRYLDGEPLIHPVTPEIYDRST